MRQHLLWLQIPLRWRKERHRDGWTGGWKEQEGYTERDRKWMCERKNKRCVWKGSQFPQRGTVREGKRERWKHREAEV